MDNHNVKTDAIMDVYKSGASQDFILIKDCLLYIGGSETIYQNGNDAPGMQHLKGTYRLPDKNILYALGSANGNFGVSDSSETGKAGPFGWKKSFLVFRNQKYFTVQTDHIAFFYIRNNCVSFKCFDKQVYTINHSLDQIIHAVSPHQFFRINRQYVVNFSAIKEVEPYFTRKLCVNLLVDTPDKLLINKERTTNFLSWMEDR
ncbi:LytR/AlgR family response regulator transcription factor [Chitinophaga pinensis]|uniref:Response regulator receiver protein n=1 Tax=Chitinophaga pinensis (strain ATCC 43595 / DSM 2588 / LMG 13176 / NBRC 15968 / NCIMB 11800 / UQM 2034) TaxID=485918 RepID=A0A979G289_CHIPD|nr:LytTR family DNA-binding domain-containing protein [Chitinophaga pinensis]ACU59577.1 response regulator receiver protein [Chitinophaga pinensis DSM 2588]